MMLKPRANPPNTMKASFKPILGISLAMLGMRSSLVNVRIPVSQKDGPGRYTIIGEIRQVMKTLPYTPEIMWMAQIIRMPSTGPENTPRYNCPAQQKTFGICARASERKDIPV
jgi:hypothetical protein